MRKLSPLFSLTVAAACGSATPGARPHDMSAAQHEREAGQHAQAADDHSDQYDSHAHAATTTCSLTSACWTSTKNPTEQHRAMAERERRAATDHRAASQALRDTEARACAGIEPDDRDISPFEHIEDISDVRPLLEQHTSSKISTSRTVGATVTFRAVPGMTTEWLQRVVDCHLARNAVLGHVAPEMPNCPLVPEGVTARVRSTGNGFAVDLRADDSTTIREIVARTDRLARRP